MSILDYSAVFNQNTLTAFYNELTAEQKATFQADFNTLGDFLRTANKGLIELLESYVLDRDSENGLLDTGIVINALYTLRNNAKIENEVSDFLAFTLKQEQAKTQKRTPYTATQEQAKTQQRTPYTATQEQAKTQQRTPYTATNKNGR